MTSHAKSLTRRTLLLAGAALGAAGLFAGALDSAGAQEAYPTKPVTIYVPYAPGGGSDAAARLLAAGLQTKLGGTFLVENKPGGSGSIALGYVARAKPDGTSLVLIEITSSVTKVLLPDLDFDPAKDLAPIGVAIESPYILVVNPALGVNTFKEFVDYVKANPGKVSFGSGGLGSGPHIASELFKSQLGVDIKHVPFRGSGPALQALLGNHIQALFTTAPAATHVHEGKLKALIVAAPQRLSTLPDTPTSTEAGYPKFQIGSWYGLAAPAGTPAAITKKLGDAIVEIANTDEVFRKGVISMGAQPRGEDAATATKRVADEERRWSELLKKADMSAPKN